MTRPRLSIWLGALACVAALASGAAAQRERSQVRGKVVDDAGAPVAGATMLLGDQRGSRIGRGSCWAAMSERSISATA